MLLKYQAIKDLVHIQLGGVSNGKNTIDLFFLHYHREKEAREKLERRIKRINCDNLLVKFNDQNGCTETEVNRFMGLPYKNKLLFTCKEWPNLSGGGTQLSANSPNMIL